MSKCLPYNQEDLSSDPKYPYKSGAVGHYHAESTILAWEPEGSHSLAKMVNSRFNEKPSKKNRLYSGHGGTHL